MLVDDEEASLRSAGLTLEYAGIDNIIKLQDSRQVIPLLANQEVELILLDLNMPHISGEKNLEVITREFPEIPVIVITGINDLDMAVKCMRMGAADYIVKPVDPDLLVARVKRTVEVLELAIENSALRNSFLSTELNNPEAFKGIVTRNPAMHAIFRYVEMVAETNRSVLISGETGVGKELIAGCIHELSGRQGDFISINVAGLDDTLFTDTLFGHERGAFTGAEQKRAGLIERAAGGTLFLDEIGDLEIPSQIKLLRLLQEGEYYPLGSDISKRANTRLVVATPHDLQKLQQEGKFRKDLYYRLCTHEIQIPPLRERMEDLPLLLVKFLQEAAAAQKKKIPTPPPELPVLLSTYHFLGNIRELQSMVFDAVAQHEKGTLSMQSFRKVLGKTRRNTGNALEEKTPITPEFLDGISPEQSFPTLKEIQRLLIERALQRAEGNQTIAAQLLGISRQALNKRLKQFHS